MRRLFTALLIMALYLFVIWGLYKLIGIKWLLSIWLIGTLGIAVAITRGYSKYFSWRQFFWIDEIFIGARYK